MRTFAVRKRRTQPRVRACLEELEGRALLSSVQPLPAWDTTYSSNWSGYAAETNLSSPASSAVTSVSGSWKVPTVTGTTTAYSSVWVGIDGYSSNSVEQLGTEQDTSSSGATYYAWWEMYPNPSVQITTMGTIHPGDSMSASVNYIGNNQFTLQMTDNTTGGSFSTPPQTLATAQRSSAEWIVEAPSSFSGILPLANFGTATFTQAQATIQGKTGPIDNSSWQNTAIDMVNRSGTPIDQTSNLTDTASAPITSSFNVTDTGSGGGGGHHHGHGPMDTVELAGPVPANVQAQSNLMVSALPADLFVSQIQQRDLASGLKTWRST